MEEILIKPRTVEETFFVKDLLQRLNIPYKIFNDFLNEEVKQSVINGQLAYKAGNTDQFVEIGQNDLWK